MRVLVTYITPEKLHRGNQPQVDSMGDTREVR